MSKNRVMDICNDLFALFKSGSFPPVAARTVIKRIAGDERPSSKWSFTNQLIMLFSGTEDARGFKQWQQVNRKVCKGARAIYILAPLTRKMEKTVIDSHTGKEIKEEKNIIQGFRPIPVFRYEDTEGEAVPGNNYSPPELPPLFHVAEHFGVVTYYPFATRELGSCSSSGGIRFHSHDVDVFFHELGHQVHNTIRPLQGGQHLEQELVAEMVSCVLCEMYGYTGYLWQGWKYMQSYAGEDPVKALRAITRVLNDVETVVAKILLVNDEITAINTAV